PSGLRSGRTPARKLPRAGKQDPPAAGSSKGSDAAKAADRATPRLLGDAKGAMGLAAPTLGWPANAWLKPRCALNLELHAKVVASVLRRPGKANIARRLEAAPQFVAALPVGARGDRPFGDAKEPRQPVLFCPERADLDASQGLAGFLIGDNAADRPGGGCQ